MIRFAIWALMMFLATEARTQNPQYPPKSEAYMDPDLEIFVRELLEAIDKRDQHYFYSVLDHDIIESFQGGGGIEQFKQEWDVEKDSSLIWPLMKRAIQLGGVFLHDTADQTGRYQFVFPYVYDMPLDIEDDYYSIGVITGKKVNLRIAPGTASPVKSQLTYDIIWFLDGEGYGKTKSGTNPFGEPEWYLVDTYDRSLRGWVNWQYVYSPISYRMFLYKDSKGHWKISAFLAGD